MEKYCIVCGKINISKRRDVKWEKKVMTNVNDILNYLQIQIKSVEENMEKIYKVQVGKL